MIVIKGFKLDDKGDVVIVNNQIQMVEDNDLLLQKVRTVLNTNKGEWWLNENEGINFRCMLTKNPNYDEIRDNIKLGLLQVDDTFQLLSFEHWTEGRKLYIKFTATNSSGQTIEDTITGG